MCFGLPILGQPLTSNDPTFIVLKSYNPDLNPLKIDQWKVVTTEMFKNSGLVTQGLEKLDLVYWFKLWGMSSNINGKPNFDLLKTNIDYWINQLGVDNLNYFILNTRHQNSYHLFVVNLESWLAMSEFMTSVGIFEGFNGPRSLNYFLLTRMWAEGAVTSAKSSPDLWLGWKDLFLSSKTLYPKLTSIFSSDYFLENTNLDLIQRIYFSLSKDLFKAIAPYQDLISDQFLVDLLKPEDNFMRSSFVSEIEIVLRQLNSLVEAKIKIKQVLITADVAKSVASKLVFQAAKNPDILKNPRYFNLTISEILSELKTQTKNKTKDKIYDSTNMCSQYLR